MRVVGKFYKVGFGMVYDPQVSEDDKNHHINYYILELACEKLLQVQVFKCADFVGYFYIENEQCHNYRKDTVYQSAQPMK